MLVQVPLISWLVELTCPDQTDEQGEPEEPADLPPVVVHDGGGDVRLI